MKRSRSVKLLTMASASLALTACQEDFDTEGELYRTVSECFSSEHVPDGDCAPLIDEGKRIHETTAPRYNSRPLCEEQGTDCSYEKSGNQAYYSPVPMGYLVTGPIAGGVVSDFVRPVYRDRTRRGYYYSTGGGYVGYLGGGRYGTTKKNIRAYNPKVQRAAPKIQTRTTVASRGGFGSRSGFSFGS
ncbi:DUF1190 domain-containing protein [Phaeobacter inhibens]|uniref:DUF1190 domain-containing protein n=1 Tax=Phaeobacter inhibens TaxID=221822 RepID=UPI0021A2EB12|nr:DUF1190 domain-containing protein [Phaeobacter inhibens]UWR60790.1 DUF1190 domain-containing protein [Phaeobacter inhibens]